MEYRIPRLIFNRFNPCWAAVMAPYMRLRTPEVLKVARSFRPEAVVSVADGYLWFVGDVVARWLNIPFHLIIYDDWPYQQTGSAPPWARPYAIRACVATEQRVFRRADGLYAISPGMADQYRDECGVHCDVIYPSRGEDSPVPKIRLQRGPGDRLVVAYAGMIHTHWARLALAGVAAQLARMGGQLDLYVPYTPKQLADWGLSRANVRLAGFFPAHEMADRVASAAHALLLPASFDAADRRDASTLFPSKLADYTGIGLPVVVWGPEYSSAARWARENPEAAVLVADPDPAALGAPLTRLKDDPIYARRLAEGAISAGLRDFDPAVVRSKFLSALRGHSSSVPPRAGSKQERTTDPFSETGH
jgi:glycosyltransferase involved in cell wall biosynthesis